MKNFIVTVDVDYELDDIEVKLEVEADTCTEIDNNTVSVNGAIIKFPEYVSVKEI